MQLLPPRTCSAAAWPTRTTIENSILLQLNQTVRIDFQSKIAAETFFCRHGADWGGTWVSVYDLRRTPGRNGREE